MNLYDTLFSLSPLARELPELTFSTAYSDSALQFLESIHRRQSEALKSVIADFGWPDESVMGEHATDAAFMVAQHADYDPDFQLLCHTLMLREVKAGRMKPAYLAFLTDRILCNQGHYQRFGTQLREAPNGCYVPKPMEDAGQVETLREEVGIAESLDDYMMRINSGDMLFYRTLLQGYADELEDRKLNKVVPLFG